ncbi:helix-turn-helix transcriptional regulator [Flavobacterium sp. ASW18X]|uniref:helix-turn-helix domain-containing protein n=1 Tax=Flavobacterium sp. ASW18X TaxID=2572595 RepID=UPI0010ADFCF7|nr:helix-turn-helix transcriptional regulator [Flavobacterium sp. ASW18X]TKD67323.1 hypothetical protein FBT53_00530 [Flavobacterium sp. ASW18X]
MKKAGELIKEYRLRRKLTLRKFCTIIEFDPSNWSKIERSLLEFPKSKSILDSIQVVLDLNNEEFKELKEIAAIESIPQTFLSEKKVLESLPVFFRTTRSENPSEEQLKELIDLIKNG